MAGPESKEDVQMKAYLRKNPLLVTGVILLAVMTALAVLIPVLSPYTDTAQNAGLRNAPSSLAHLFGTDKFGRDIFVRVFSGTRISLSIGIGSAVICGAVGILYGSAAGCGGEKTDMLLMRAADVIDSIPSLLYVILIMLVMGASAGSILLGFCIGGWVGLARIVRGEIRRLRSEDFCTAARLLGAGTGRILFVHLLPNAAGAIIVNLTFLIPKAMFTEAFLSFVGVGISAPAASLGTLIQDARSQIQVVPAQMLYPILVLCILLLSVNLVGAGLEKAVCRAEEG